MSRTPETRGTAIQAASIQTLLFDLDGTLIDTEPAAAYAITETFREWAIDLSIDDSRFIAGRTWDTAFRYLFEKYEIPVSAQEASQTMLDRYRKAMDEKLVLVAGGVEAVRALSGHFKIGLVSGSFRQEIFWALDRLAIRPHFEVVLGAEDYPKSKPAPDGYLKAIDMLGARPESTLIFEDSEPGIGSAIAAGAWVVAIEATNHFGQDTSLAHDHIRDLTGVDPSWVEAFAKRVQLKSP